ncbi:MAG: SUMF1/EgtB/PvdO family nonheme iron enzyme [Sedimentisphaerales bacterium]
MKWTRNRVIVVIMTAAMALFLSVIAGLLRIYYADMVHVEAGQFQMGCSDGQHCEKPVHTVKLGGFWIDKYEVTNSQYARFLNCAQDKGWVEIVQEDYSEGTYLRVNINGHRALTVNHPSISYDEITYSDEVFAAEGEKEDFPVHVTWHGAMAYCEAFGKRLPTEAEWEYAAKGGHLSRFVPGEVEYFRYSGSDVADEVAWHKDNASWSQPVGQLKANELGIFDMSGNLREWTSDWCDLNYYATSPQENPQGPPDPVNAQELDSVLGKVMRGGSWFEPTLQEHEDESIEFAIDGYRVRVTKRNYGCPSNISQRTGFRCASSEKRFPPLRWCGAFSTLVKPKSAPPDLWPIDPIEPGEPVE